MGRNYLILPSRYADLRRSSAFSRFERVERIANQCQTFHIDKLQWLQGIPSLLSNLFHPRVRLRNSKTLLIHLLLFVSVCVARAEQTEAEKVFLSLSPISFSSLDEREESPSSPFFFPTRRRIFFPLKVAVVPKKPRNSADESHS